VEHQAKLPQKQGALGQIAAKRKQVFGDETDAAIETKIEAVYKKYCAAGQAAAALDRCKELEAALASRIGALTTENQRYFGLRALAELDFPGAVKAVRDTNAQLAGSVEPLIAEKLAVLQSADALAAKLEDAGEVQADGVAHAHACPVKTPRRHDQLTANILTSSRSHSQRSRDDDDNAQDYATWPT
jgi:hypothetical protein